MKISFFGGMTMYERLLDKNVKPTMEEFVAHIGIGKELFENIDAFLINELNLEKEIKFDAHSRCWKINFRVKRKYICDIIAEKDAFTIVTRLSEENIEKVYDDISLYANKCIDNSPFRHRGWIEYRVLCFEHLEDAKTILKNRAKCKQ